MNILIVKLSPIEAITSSMFRTLAIAKGAFELDNEVDMLVLPMTKVHVEGNLPDFVEKITVIRTTSNNAFNQIVEKKSGGIKSAILQGFRKTWHKLFIYDNTYLVAKKIDIGLLPKKKYDLVISSSDPKTSHVVVKELIKQGLNYSRWIQYWGDPLSIDITQKSIYPKFVLKIFERNLIKNADKIVYVSPFTLKEQQRIFPDLALKMEFHPVAYMKEKIFPETTNSQFTIGYYGSYTSSVRNIIPLYNACKKLGKSVHLDILGDSDIELNSTDNISIYPRGVADEFEKRADLLVCILNLKGTQIPGKIYHVAGTNKRVLVIVDGDEREKMISYLESFNRYMVCDNNMESIMKSIESAMNKKDIVFPVEQLSYLTIAKEILK